MRGRPQLDLGRKVKDILQHVGPMPPEADMPVAHYRRSANDLWLLLDYFDRKLKATGYYPAVYSRHTHLLHSMVLVNLIEAFERYLKEAAAVCINHVAPHIADDRLDVFRNIRGSLIAAHFGSDNPGRSLCDSETWLDCSQVNDRFRRILADPYTAGEFYVFPRAGTNQRPKEEQFRYETMEVAWQIRHTIVHNVGVITPSDAVKLRVLAREQVSSPRVLLPTRDDLRYLKRFLDETAESANRRVGTRLAELLTLFHRRSPGLLDARETADQLSNSFQVPLTVADETGTP